MSVYGTEDDWYLEAFPDPNWSIKSNGLWASLNQVLNLHPKQKIVYHFCCVFLIIPKITVNTICLCKSRTFYSHHKSCTQSIVDKKEWYKKKHILSEWSMNRSVYEMDHRFSLSWTTSLLLWFLRPFLLSVDRRISVRKTHTSHRQRSQPHQHSQNPSIFLSLRRRLLSLSLTHTQLSILLIVSAVLPLLVWEENGKSLNVTVGIVWIERTLTFATVEKFLFL